MKQSQLYSIMSEQPTPLLLVNYCILWFQILSDTKYHEWCTSLNLQGKLTPPLANNSNASSHKEPSCVLVSFRVYPFVLFFLIM